MSKKKLLIIGIGLVVLIIAAGVAYQNYEYARLAKKQVDTLSATIRQKDIRIMDLTKEAKAKADELSSVKAELDNLKKVIEDLKTRINSASEPPAIQAPQVPQTPQTAN
jgi:peptidoglycan hydrolase CwlO-like protein